MKVPRARFTVRRMMILIATRRNQEPKLATFTIVNEEQTDRAM
jgi:hypothetical protein